MSERKMTREHATTEANKRWGDRAFADWFTTEGDPPVSECVVGYFSYPGMGMERIHRMGSGVSWESAFKDADERSPPMTRCPKCGLNSGIHFDGCPNHPMAGVPVACSRCGVSYVPDGAGQRPCCLTPASSLLDFNRARQAGGVTFYSPGPQLVAEEADLNAQAAALVKAEREDGVWKRAYDDLHGQFQRETLRTSELSALVKRFIDEHHVRGGHPAIRWTKECVLCVILADAVALLAKPLNEEARDDHR